MHLRAHAALYDDADRGGSELGEREYRACGGDGRGRVVDVEGSEGLVRYEGCGRLEWE